MRRKYFLIVLFLILAIFLNGCSIGIVIPVIPDHNEEKIRSVVQNYYSALNNQNWNKAKSYCVYGSDKYYKTCRIEDKINTLYFYCNFVTINTYVDISDVSIYGNYSQVYCYVSATIRACGYVVDSTSGYGSLHLQKMGNRWKLY